MKKLFSLAFVFAMVFALVIPAVSAGAEPVEIDKKAFDAFPAQKHTANNKHTGLGDFELVSDSKAGWRLFCNNPDLVGTIDVAYKIGPRYFIVTFDVNGEGEFYIGDGSGKNGVNMVKVGKFVSPALPEDPLSVDVGFIGLYANPDQNYTTSIHWEHLKNGVQELVDWDAVYEAYASDPYLVVGWFDESRVLSWQSSGAKPKYFEGARPKISISDFSDDMLESYYECYYLEPVLSEVPPTPNKPEKPNKPDKGTGGGGCDVSLGLIGMFGMLISSLVVLKSKPFTGK